MVAVDPDTKATHVPRHVSRGKAAEQMNMLGNFCCMDMGNYTIITTILRQLYRLKLNYHADWF